MILKKDSGDEHKFCTTLMEKTVRRIGILNSDLFSDQFFLQCSKLGDEILDLCHHCYQLADCSAGDLKIGQTKSGAAGQICCRFCTERAEKGPNIWKICFLILISLTLGMFKKYYTFSVFSSTWTKIVFFC
jgi:hypothetical protein